MTTQNKPNNKVEISYLDSRTPEEREADSKIEVTTTATSMPTKPNNKVEEIVEGARTTLHSGLFETYEKDGEIVAVSVAGVLFYGLSALTSTYSTARAEEAKAYGGCTKCYGKGYSTQIVQIGNSRHLSKPKTQITYCECDRGVALENLLSPSKPEANPTKGE